MRLSRRISLEQGLPFFAFPRVPSHEGVSDQNRKPQNSPTIYDVLEVLHSFRVVAQMQGDDSEYSEDIVF